MKKINKKVAAFICIIILFIATLVTTIPMINNKKNKTQATSGTEEIEKQNLLNETIEDFMNLEDLTKTSNEIEEKSKTTKATSVANDTNNKATKTMGNTNKNKYYIKVNYGAQVVNIYTYDQKGNYTVPVKAFICSTGTETPKSGVYKIPAKIKWCFMYGDVYAQYCTQIVGDILFHSVPYLKRSNDTLEYWAYDKLGTKDSLGCVRLTARDAKWIFDNVSYGTQVEFYSDSNNPGPLGKPTAQKISNAPPNLRNWDPTDPDSRNPWKTYKQSGDKTDNIKNEIKNTETNEIDNITNNVEENNTNQITNNEEVTNSVSNNEKTNQISNESQNNQIFNNTLNEDEKTNINNEVQNKETNNVVDNTN